MSHSLKPGESDSKFFKKEVFKTNKQKSENESTIWGAQ